MRESFIRAANILDPEWIQTNSSDCDGIRNISTIEAKVSRNQRYYIEKMLVKRALSIPHNSWYK